MDIDGMIPQAAFIEAFYTTSLFKVERTLLGWVARRPSTDGDARQLAEGRVSTFAAWRVEDRNAEQLLLADFTGSTKSWLMVEPTDGGRTNLYFGSAVVPRVDARTGERKMGLIFNALLGFHRLYSTLLLQSARSRILARGHPP